MCDVTAEEDSYDCFEARLVVRHDLHDEVHEWVQRAFGSLFTELSHQGHGRCLGAVHVLYQIVPLHGQGRTV